MERLYRKYKDKRFTVIGFPCNQFSKQDAGTNEEIQHFCKTQFNVTFPVMAKITVNGENESGLFTFLKKQAGGIFGKSIKWNFTKFLVDRSGTKVKRYGSIIKPEKLTAHIEKLL